MRRLQLLSVISMFVLLSSCGGGTSENAAVPSAPANTTVYSTGGRDALTTGETHTAELSGSDTAGGTSTGTQQSVVDGPTTVDGKDVIQETVTKTLTRSGGATATSSETIYYNTDGTIYKIVYPDGRSATPSNNFELPATVKVGDSGTGRGLNYSDGNVSTSTWLVTDAGGGNASLTYTFYLNSVLREQHITTLTPTGYAPTIMYILYNFPYQGVITTLQGKDQ